MATKMKKNSDNIEFPKIPVHKLYKKKPFWSSPSYSIKDFEKTIILESSEKSRSLNLLDYIPADWMTMIKYNFVHLGLVQVAIKPLARDGVNAPVIVCLRDSRHLDFQNSLLALVNSNLSQGPLFFNCFPSFTVPISDLNMSSSPLLLLFSITGVPFALTVRTVCKTMVDLRADYLEKPVLGKTTYFIGNSATPLTTQWDQVVQDNESTQLPGPPQDPLMLTSVASAK